MGFAEAMLRNLSLGRLMFRKLTIASVVFFFFGRGAIHPTGVTTFLGALLLAFLCAMCFCSV